MNLLNCRNASTLMFLCLPAFGLWQMIEGLYDGPNYFDSKIVTIENLDSTSYTTRGDRSSAPESYTDWTLDYNYTDYHGKVRHGQKVFRYDEVESVIYEGLPREWKSVPHGDPLPDHRKPGDQFLTRIAVDKEEGKFGLNSKVEVGNGVFLFLVC